MVVVAVVVLGVVVVVALDVSAALQVVSCLLMKTMTY